MRINVVKSKNATSYYLTKDVFHNGKRSTKIVEKIGTKAEMRKKYSDWDPLVQARNYAKEKILAEKKVLQEKAETVIVKYDSTKQISAHGTVLYNVGSLFYNRFSFNYVWIEFVAKFHTNINSNMT